MGQLTTPDVVFRAKAMSKAFGPVQALNGVDIDVRPGDALALIGENGAGKSTLMKLLSGALQPDSGTMELNGRSYAPASPSQGRMAGVAMIYQELTLAPHLSVEENIVLGMEPGHLARPWRQRDAIRRILRDLGHDDMDPTQPVSELSIGKRQVVEIARALHAEAQVVVMDEPTSSLAGNDVQALFDAVRRLCAAGKAVIYISHFLEEIQDVCNRYVVLRDGRSVAAGEVAGTSIDTLISAMIGRRVDDMFVHGRHQPGEVVMAASEVSGKHVPVGVSLELRRGEVLGIAGLVGAGRTELLRILAGLDKARSGAFTRRGGAEGRGRVQLLSEDRKGEGLATSMRVADNITLPGLARYAKSGFLSLGREKTAAAGLARRLKVKCRTVDDRVDSLSGGNQQKVALARLIHEDAVVLLMDEPTRGIDVGSKAEIYQLIDTLAAEGRAIVIVSSYLPELFGVSDRIGVMYKGTLSPIRPVAEWSHATVMRFATSGVMTEAA